MESPQRINLYVTYVEKEGPFLKLWGQTDKNNALYIEQFLAQIASQFDLGVGKVSPETLPPGTLVCAKYKDNKYYRAKILNSAFVRDGSLEVNFIDFGNKGVVSSSFIRSLQNFQPSVVSIPPLAVGFIFAEAHCVGGGEWNDTIFESIAKEIKYREVACTLLTQATNYYLVRISVEGTDLCSVLIQRGLMQPISLQAQQAVLLSMSMQKQGTMSQNQTTGGLTPQINTYKACTLEPGCQYPVYVSYVNDGPCHFSVQLKQTEDVLVMLMNDINGLNLRLLEDTPIPGTICLAMCTEDSNICRAVVTNEVDTQFKVFYVDFGNYEVLPLDSLYQIPFKYVLPKVMAIRFSLAGVDKSTVTMDMQVAFKKFVDNRLLHMKVLPSPTRTALPKCELWDPETKTSALDVVIRSAKHSYPEPVALTRGFSQPVKVSFVYSCNRFYVQLVNKESELTTLMNDLQTICQTTDFLDPNSIKEGVPCCALFSADGQWYRSQIVEASANNIKVRYIDYGNEESISSDQLKSISGEILTVLRPQAIECCLNGYQNMEPDEERDALLEELILEGVFTMKVADTFNKKTLVDLFDDSNYNVASLLLEKLAAAKSQVSPMLVVQAGNKIEHRKSYTNQREFQNFDKGERNYNTGREHKSWDKPNDRNDRNERSEKSWRQDSRENSYNKGKFKKRNYDNNTNENNDRNSWRQTNKGFSPNARLEKYKNQDDSWKTTENTDWENNTQKTSKTNSTSWKDTNSNTAKDSWNDQDTNENAEDSRPKRNDFRKGGYNNSERGGGFGGKPRDGNFKKRDFRKDGSEMSSSGSEKSFHKGPRSSSRIDKGRGGHNFDQPRKSYRDNRNGGGDSWNANNTTTEDSWNVSSVAPSIDAAPATATFVSYDIVGTEGNIIISWFHNPGLFYVQQVSSQETFKTMMEEICDFYKNKKPERVVKGAPIIALFDEDNVLYRARVLEVIGTQYKVYYVDFGNVSTVSKAYPIEKKFMNLPAQAIPCALDGVAPTTGAWAEPDLFSNYFNKDNFVCRFVNKDEEKTYVNVFVDTEDVGQLLIRDGLAVSTASAIPDIEIPLLLGQQFRATVKSVNNLGDIILALECGLAVNCTMHNLETATESFEDTLKSLLEEAVIVYVDNVLEDYRLEITLYDTEGNKHVILNPDEGAFETVDIPCPTLILRSVVSGYVPFADESTVFIQLNEYADAVTFLLDQLFEKYDGKDHDSTIIPEEGMIYAVHSQDGNWYRGKVISFDDEKATVTYVDYGNSEDVAFVELRQLDTKFLDIAILSLQVTVLSEGETFVDKEVIANIYYGDAGWEGSVQLVDSSSTALITQVENVESAESTDTGFATSSIEKPEDIHEELIEDTVEVSESAIVNETEPEPVSAPVEQKTIGNPVFMSHIDSPSDFYLQFHETLGEIEALQVELQENVAEMEVLENPVAGVLCAAPYAADQQWYRAEVLDADEDITTVRFIDFGNTDVIDNNSTKVKTLPPKLLSLAIYATRCSLKIQSVEDEWSSTSLVVFETLTKDGNLTAEFLEQDEKCTYVELYADGINIKDALVKENLAKIVTNTSEGKQTGFVSHLNSPSEFWIQLENCVDELEWIAEQLSNAESFSELEDLTPGTLCAALFPDDQMWYRARILSNTVAGIELLFIDYGNSCTSSSLRQLPEDLVITAPLALKCGLQKNEGIPTWSSEAAEKFAEISADGQTIFTVKKISTGETSVVQLLVDGHDVTTMLLPSTEEGFVKEVETLEKLSIEMENGKKVEVVALEPLEGQELGEEAKEKFEELNEQGTTRFQIEFVGEKSVRLYLNGKDIRSLLGSFKNPSLNTTITEDLDANSDLNEVNTRSQIEDIEKYRKDDLDETIVKTETIPVEKNYVKASSENELGIETVKCNAEPTQIQVDVQNPKTSQNYDENSCQEEETIDYVETDLQFDAEEHEIAVTQAIENIAFPESDAEPIVDTDNEKTLPEYPDPQCGLEELNEIKNNFIDETIASDSDSQLVNMENREQISTSLNENEKISDKTVYSNVKEEVPFIEEGDKASIKTNIDEPVPQPIAIEVKDLSHDSDIEEDFDSTVKTEALFKGEDETDLKTKQFDNIEIEDGENETKNIPLNEDISVSESILDHQHEKIVNIDDTDFEEHIDSSGQNSNDKIDIKEASILLTTDPKDFASSDYTEESSDLKNDTEDHASLLEETNRPLVESEDSSVQDTRGIVRNAEQPDLILEEHNTKPCINIAEQSSDLIEDIEHRTFSVEEKLGEDNNPFVLLSGDIKENVGSEENPVVLFEDINDFLSSADAQPAVEESSTLKLEEEIKEILHSEEQKDLHLKDSDIDPQESIKREPIDENTSATNVSSDPVVLFEDINDFSSSADVQPAVEESSTLKLEEEIKEILHSEEQKDLHLKDSDIDHRESIKREPIDKNTSATNVSSDHLKISAVSEEEDCHLTVDTEINLYQPTDAEELTGIPAEDPVVVADLPTTEKCLEEKLLIENVEVLGKPKSPVKKEVSNINEVKKPSPVKVSKETAKTVSPVKDSKLPAKKSLPVSSKEALKVTPVKSTLKNAASKTTASKGADKDTKTSPKSAPLRTSLSMPKVLSSKKEEEKSPVKKESPGKVSPKKVFSDSKILSPKKSSPVKNDSRKILSPKKDVGLEKKDTEKPETIVKGVLKDVVDLACSGDKSDL